MCNIVKFEELGLNKFNDFYSFFFNPLYGLIYGIDNKVYIVEKDKLTNQPIFKLRYTIDNDANISDSNIRHEQNLRYATSNSVCFSLYTQRNKNPYPGPQEYLYYGGESYANIRYIRGKNKTIFVVANIKDFGITQRGHISEFFTNLFEKIDNLLPDDGNMDTYLLRPNKDETDYEFLKIDKNSDDFLGLRYTLKEVAEDAGCQEKYLEYDKTAIDSIY